MNEHTEVIRLKQEILFYKAELAKSNSQTLEVERALQKEVIRNKFLQQKRKEWLAEKESYVRRLEELQNRILELEVIVEEDKQPLQQNNPIQNKNHDMSLPYGYFSYCVILPARDETSITIYGDFHIVNEAKIFLEDLIVCFKVHPIGAVTFSGKISDPKFIKRSEGSSDEIDWIYSKENWKKASIREGEYWVKPNKATCIENLSLTGLELTIPTELNIRKVRVEAFMYLSKEASPISAMNKINIQIP